jgi:mannose-1-phosphate guanylyltransferase
VKAFILAAGMGTRLKPLTDTTPKCLVELSGKPLLEWWFILMRAHGITEFLINTHHLASQVKAFVETVAPSYGLDFQIVHEPELIGSAGTLAKNAGFARGEKDFFVLYADTLTDSDLTALLDFHRGKNADLTMILLDMDHPETRGIAELGSNQEIVSFIEKPNKPKTNLANGGNYVMSARMLDEIVQGRSGKSVYDIGSDILTLTQEKSGLRYFGLEVDCYLRDIGTLESLELANQEWNPQ